MAFGRPIGTMRCGSPRALLRPWKKPLNCLQHLTKIADEARGPYLRLKAHSLVGVGRHQAG